MTYRDSDYISTLGAAFTARRLQRLADAFVDDIEAFLRAQGLQVPGRAVSTLLLIKQSPGLAITQVARQVQMSHPLIINLLSNLEQLRLVEFRHDENDRRRRLIFLTEMGQDEAVKLSATLPVIRAAYAELGREAGVDLSGIADRLDSALERRSFRQRLDGVADIRALLAEGAPEN